MFSGFTHINFANPWWLLLLSLIPLLSLYYIFKLQKKYASLQVSNTDWLAGKPHKTIRQRLIHLPFILRMLVIALLSIVMARPQTSDSSQTTNIEGIDIALAIDVSGSMKAMDFKPNRLEAAKETAEKFIDGRPNDRMALVVFSGEAYTQCPLTTDHQVIKDLLKPLKNGMIEDGTALGDGLATAINRIKDSKAISKVVILLTDGVQNMGSLDPVTASKLAQKFGIRVYTIGVGSRGEAPMKVQGPFGDQIVRVPVQIDEEVLKEVAKNTDGRYFRATNNQSLDDVFVEIDQLEKSKIEVNVFKTRYDQYRWLLWPALILFVIEIILRLSVLRIKI
jgi:Ca-activated chloride channel family protein